MFEILGWFGLCAVGYFTLIVLWRPATTFARRFRYYLARRQRLKSARIAMTLLVKVDGDLVQPSAQLRGGPLPKNAVLRLEIVDDQGRKRHAAKRRISPEELQREISLQPFSLTAGSPPEEIVSWRWDVSIKVRRRMVDRWSVYLTPFAGLNAEAEIDRAIV